MATSTSTRRFAIVTGASSGIGLELARCCANAGFDLLICADEPSIRDVREELERRRVSVEAIQTDLATIEGVEELWSAARSRPVDALLANAGVGLGHAFLEQDWPRIERVIDTNIRGTVYLIHKVGRAMQARRSGRILITGSIAGLMPGTYQAVYNGSKAFLDSFAYALRCELEGTGVTVTCLMPGATETDFFERAELLDTKVGTSKKQSPEEVARLGFEAMMRGSAGVVTGWQNKLRAAMSRLASRELLAKQHARMAAPGSAR